MTSFRKIATIALLLVPLSLPTAHADETSDVAVVVGTGSISPGLPTSGCAFQSVAFQALLTVNAGDHAGLYNVSFSGSSAICETLGSGQGGGTLFGDVSGTVQYTRNGSYVSITGSGAVNGAPHHIDRGDCVFVPTAASPVSSYALYCQVVLGSGA